MPISEGTIVKRVGPAATAVGDSKKRVVRKPVEEDSPPQPLFDFKESKYHDDLLNRDPKN